MNDDSNVIAFQPRRHEIEDSSDLRHREEAPPLHSPIFTLDPADLGIAIACHDLDDNLIAVFTFDLAHVYPTGLDPDLLRQSWPRWRNTGSGS